MYEGPSASAIMVMHDGIGEKPNCYLCRKDWPGLAGGILQAVWTAARDVSRVCFVQLQNTGRVSLLPRWVNPTQPWLRHPRPQCHAGGPRVHFHTVSVQSFAVRPVLCFHGKPQTTNLYKLCGYSHAQSKGKPVFPFQPKGAVMYNTHSNTSSQTFPVVNQIGLKGVSSFCC